MIVVKRDGESATIDLPAGVVTVFPIHRRPEHEMVGFSGPQMQGKDGRRLQSRVRRKAAQAAVSGAGWLRIDVFDGLWQFTEFAVASLKEKGEMLDAWMRPSLLSAPGVVGAVFACGRSSAQGQFFGESARLSGGGYALRRTLYPGRVREALILPVSTEGVKQAERWLDLYDEEEKWIDWALDKVGLAPAALVFAQGRPINL